MWPDNWRILWWFAHRGACQNASLNAVPPAGCPAGGLGPWEDTLQGAAAGLFLQGAGSLLRFEDHAGLRQQMDALVSAIESFQEADGYAMAFARNDSYRRENPNYVTAWLTHGMLEAHIAGNPAALPLIRRHLNWYNNHSFLPLMLPTLGGPASLDPSKPTPDGFPAGTGAEDAAGYGGGFRGDGCSLGGVTNSQPPGFCINHHLLYLSYQGMIKHTRMALTPLGTAADVRTALLYAEDWWLDRLAARDPAAIWQRRFYPHNYENTAFEAYVEMYVLTGDLKYIDGVLGAWDLMMAHWLHVGGSVALSEQTWFPPDSYYFQGSGEMCGSVFWLKLNHRLHRLFPDEERFVGEVERSLYNVVVAGQGIDANGTRGGGIRYHAQLHGAKEGAGSSGSCCEGSGGRALGGLPELLYSIGANDTSTVTVNIPAPSTLSWQSPSGVPVALTCSSAYPFSGDNVTLQLAMPKPVVLTLRIRVPRWVEAATAANVTVFRNEKPCTTAAAGTYATLSATWSDGDRVTYSLPMAFRTTLYTGAVRIPSTPRRLDFAQPVVPSTTVTQLEGGYFDAPSGGYVHPPDANTESACKAACLASPECVQVTWAPGQTAAPCATYNHVSTTWVPAPPDEVQTWSRGSGGRMDLLDANGYLLGDFLSATDVANETGCIARCMGAPWCVAVTWRAAAAPRCCLYTTVHGDLQPDVGVREWIKRVPCGLPGGGPDNCVALVDWSSHQLHRVPAAGAGTGAPMPLPNCSTFAACDGGQAGALVAGCRAPRLVSEHSLATFVPGVPASCAVVPNATAGNLSRYALEYGPLLLAATGPWDTAIDCIRIPWFQRRPPIEWLRPDSQRQGWFTVIGAPEYAYAPYMMIQGEQMTVFPVWDAPSLDVDVNWASTGVTTAAIPTYLDQVNPGMSRASKLHDAVFARIAELGADRVRYLHWDPFPHISYPEPTAPTAAGPKSGNRDALATPPGNSTSWQFDRPWITPPDTACVAAGTPASACVTNTSIDDYVQDFMAASVGHDSVINFSPLPAWLLFGSPPPPPPPPPPPTPGLCSADCAMVAEPVATFYVGPSYSTNGSCTTEMACQGTCLGAADCSQFTWWPVNPVAAQRCALYWGRISRTQVKRTGVTAGAKCKRGQTVAAQCAAFAPPDGLARTVPAPGPVTAPRGRGANTAGSKWGASGGGGGGGSGADGPYPSIGPRDPSGVEAGDYFSRIVSWYTKGGLTDEAGVWHPSGHHFKWTNWEVLNEVDSSSPLLCLKLLNADGKTQNLTECAVRYTRFYDGVVGVLQRDHADLGLKYAPTFAIIPLF